MDNKTTNLIELSNPKVEWEKNFQCIANILFKICGDLIKEIEHIGSTAIIGIKAKDIIDIQCGVNNFSQIKTLTMKLTGLGLSQLEHIKQDHVPFHDFAYFEKGWEKRFFTGLIQNIHCNVHIRILESANWNFAIQFRDYLNKNEKVAIAYEQIKTRLAKSGVNKQDYCYIKDPVCDLIYYAVKTSS